MKILIRNNKEDGVALLLTVVILSIVLFIAIFIVNNVVTQLKLVGDINDSTIAIYAADAGIEWQLYQIKKGVTVSSPVMSNGAIISTTVTGAAPSYTVKSLGSYQSVKRQFEISF